MDFALSDNQKNIIATFREFGESVFTPESVFQWRKDQGLPDEVVKGFVDRYFALDDQSPDGMGIMSQTLSWKSFAVAQVPPFHSKTTCSICRSWAILLMRRCLQGCWTTTVKRVA